MRSSRMRVKYVTWQHDGPKLTNNTLLRQWTYAPLLGPTSLLFSIAIYSVC